MAGPTAIISVSYLLSFLFFFSFIYQRRLGRIRSEAYDVSLSYSFDLFLRVRIIVRIVFSYR